MIEISLWGNATDLSLLATIKFEDLERLQGKKAILEQQKNIVVNDMEEVFEYFDTLKDAQIDIVLDNAGSPPSSPHASPSHCLMRTIVLHLPPSILQFSLNVVYILRDSIRDSIPDPSNNNRLRTLRRHVPSLLPPRNKPRKNNNPPPQELRLVRLRRPPLRHHLFVPPA